MSVAIVIPARYGSQRLQGKPMLSIAGVSLLERVWRIARVAKGASRVVVATEDERVAAFARGFGAEAPRTTRRKIAPCDIITESCGDNLYHQNIFC